MASSTKQRSVPIDAETRARFDRCAPAALARRTPARLRGLALNMLQWLVIGTVGLLGIYLWHWSPLNLLIVWLAGIAAGIVGDLLLYLVARRRLVRQFEAFSDDQFVWHMVMALRRRQDHVLDSALQAFRAGTSLALDLVFGGLAAAVFVYWFAAKGIDVPALVAADPTLRNALLAVAAAPLVNLVSALATIASSADAEVDFHAGGRGLALFAMTIAFLVFSDSDDVVRSLIVFVNGATVFVGLLAAFGVWVMGQERDWLARHLAAR
jgi:hypothetical protein